MTDEFRHSWEAAVREQAKVWRQHIASLIRGYGALIDRYEKLGMKDRLADAEIVRTRLERLDGGIGYA